MRRKQFNFAAAVSLIMCLTMVALCVAVTERHTLFIGKSPRYAIGFDHHAIFLAQDTAVSDEAINAALQRLSYAGFSRNRNDYTLGGEAQRIKDYGPFYLAIGDQTLHHELSGSSNWWAHWPLGPWWQFSVSYWLLIVVLVAFPCMWAFTTSRRRLRRARGNCAICGYSLTGNVSGVCPECGTPVVATAGAKA